MEVEADRPRSPPFSVLPGSDAGSGAGEEGSGVGDMVEETPPVTEASDGEAFVTGVIELSDSSGASEPGASPPIKKKRCESLGSLASLRSLPEARVVLEALPLPQRERRGVTASSTPARAEARPRLERASSTPSLEGSPVLGE
jgi:hypothetical protein